MYECIVRKKVCSSKDLIEWVDVGYFVHQCDAVALVGHGNQLGAKGGRDELGWSTL